MPRKSNFTLPASVRRNPVVRALAALSRRGSGQHQSVKRQKDADRKDLADRVREFGEW